MNSLLENSYAWTGSLVEALTTLACDITNLVYSSFNLTSNEDEISVNLPETSEKAAPKVPQVLTEAASWFAADDFQLLLLKIFVAILITNIGLIYITWHIYGERITDTFMTPNISPEELKEQIKQLKLPTEHSQRFS